jgi:S-adenosylmethionine synthetase
LRTKVGEAPVLYSQVDLEYNKSVLQTLQKTVAISTQEHRQIQLDMVKKKRPEYIVKPGNIKLKK